MSNNICIHIQSTQFPFITYGMVLYINNSIPTSTNIEQMYVYASELRKFWHFYIFKLLFLSIFCRYIRYFVGTNDMLFGLHVPTNFQMYRQNSEKALLGGGVVNCPPAPPPPPPLATLMCSSYITEIDGINKIWVSKFIFSETVDLRCDWLKK